MSSAVFARDTRQTNVEIISLRLFNQADGRGVTADDATGAVGLHGVGNSSRLPGQVV